MINWGTHVETARDPPLWPRCIKFDTLGAGTDKPIDWRGSSLEDLQEFAETARKQAGQELRIRINCADGWFMVMYVAKFEEAIYVLHSFQKKSRRTARSDVEIARTRYRAVARERKASK